jgi:O-antigen/teichoic acid export membrane protein
MQDFNLKKTILLQKLFLIFHKKTDQSLERSRILVLTSLISFFSKGINFIVIILSVPLTIKYLGSEKFGFVNVLISSFSILVFSDLGMGMGLQNSLPGFIVKNDRTEIKKVISTTFFFLLITSFILLCSLITFSQFTNWKTMFNIGQNIKSQEINQSVICFIFIVCLGIPATLIQRIQNAYQIGYISEIWIMVGNILSLVSLYLVIYFNLEMPWVIFSMQGVVYGSFLLNFIVSFFVSKKYEIPSFKYFDKTILKLQVRLGLSYLILSICAFFVNSIDSLLIGRFYDMEKVTEFSVGFKLVSIISIPVIIFSAPLLAAYNDSWVKKDKYWMKQAFIRYFKWISLYSLISSIIILFFGNIILKFWIGKGDFNNYQLLMFCLLLIYLNYNALISMISLSTRFLKYLLKIYPLAVIVSFIIKLFFLNNSSEYLNIVWATLLPMTFLFFLPILFKIYREDFK